MINMCPDSAFFINFALQKDETEGIQYEILNRKSRDVDRCASLWTK